MKRRKVLSVIGAAAAAAVSVKASSVHEKFAGTYKLVMSQRTANPMGRVGYEKNGRVWCLIAPPRMAPKDRRNVTIEEYKELLNGLVSYYGTFDVDETKKIITHHIEA